MFTVFADAPSGFGGNSMLIYLVIMVVIFYFLLIRPQQRQKKQRTSMMDSLNVGDEIYTAGGILGTITRIKEQTIWLRISDKCEIELLKTSIGGLKAKEENQTAAKIDS
ncbi:MAG: preprotein translocase subunit YajC [Firmicutes bacterium]|nr:preprotein translocase subunit YajC [Bacillota bacterium]